MTVRPDETLEEYVRNRLRQNTLDSYAGVAISKFPEDLRVYEHLIWISRPDVVIELGVQYGGSSLWFRDRLNALARYHRISSHKVILIDKDLGLAQEHLKAADPNYETDITLAEGDVSDPDLPARRQSGWVMR